MSDDHVESTEVLVVGDDNVPAQGEVPATSPEEAVRRIQEAQAYLAANARALAHSGFKLLQFAAPAVAAMIGAAEAGAVVGAASAAAAQATDEGMMGRLFRDLDAIAGGVQREKRAQKSVQSQEQAGPERGDQPDTEVPEDPKVDQDILHIIAKAWHYLRDEKIGRERFELIRRVAVAGHLHRLDPELEDAWRRAMGDVVVMETVAELSTSHALVLGSLDRIGQDLRDALRAEYNELSLNSNHTTAARQVTRVTERHLRDLIAKHCYFGEYRAHLTMKEMLENKLLYVEPISPDVPLKTIDNYDLTGPAATELLWFLRRYDADVVPLVKAAAPKRVQAEA